MLVREMPEVATARTARSTAVALLRAELGELEAARRVPEVAGKHGSVSNGAWYR